MFFYVLPVRSSDKAKTTPRACLIIDNWDDWGTFTTQYYLTVIDTEDNSHEIGSVKIGQLGMKKGQKRPDLPKSFDVISNSFFSLGQDEGYYEALNKLGPVLRDRILVGLRDVAADDTILANALSENVMKESLLRSVTLRAVRGQFRRLTKGGARLTPYKFRYTAAKSRSAEFEPVELSFVVKPESQPATNIHVIIGSNGVGKTHMLHHMTRSLIDVRPLAKTVGRFCEDVQDIEGKPLFANVVSVTFSAFDPFKPLAERRDKSTGIQYAYVGLKRLPNAGKNTGIPKSPEMLGKEFVNSVRLCVKEARSTRWKNALQCLEADPIFRDAQVAELANNEVDDFEQKALELFEQLSSGHRLVLLTITRLVETVEERSLVLLDEPEAHLHPPLLSAFIRALSDLLIDRNGVAIIATHSPVVLQEVPRTCVWKLRRSGSVLKAERPELETFGENVGVLTREVFGLQVTHSGFHKVLRDAVEKNLDYEDILEQFDSQLGAEARAIARALVLAHASAKKEVDN